MKSKDLAQNFVNQYKKPFSAEIMSAMTGMELAQCQRVIKRMTGKGTLRELEKGIYVCPREREISHSTRVGSGNWAYKIESARQILEQIDMGNNKGCREIAKALGVSRQYVYMYLVGLCSIGSVGFNLTGYYVERTDNLLSLGSNLQPGILGRLRQQQRDLWKTR